MRRCRATCSLNDGEGGSFDMRCEERRGHERTTVHRVNIGQLSEFRWPGKPKQAKPPNNLKWPVAIRRAAFAVWAPLMFVAVRTPVWPTVGIFVCLVIPLNVACEISYWRYRRGLGEAVGDRERAGTATATSTGAGAAFASGLAAGVTAGAGPGGTHLIGRAGGQLIVQNNTFSRRPAMAPAGEDARLSERAGDLPLLAFKVAQLVWTIGKDFGPALVSVYGSLPWGSEDAICVQCERPKKHEHIPDEHCTCGFYGRRSPDDIDIPAGESNVLVDVELYGRVIVYERGYRAQHQRLLRVGLGPCWYCNGPATVVGGNAPVPVEYTVKNGGGGLVSTHTELSTEPARLWPFCDHHVDLSATNLRMPVPELAERLGVPVETVHAS